MGKILKAIAILLIITSIVFGAGCLNEPQTPLPPVNNITENVLSKYEPVEVTDPLLVISPEKKFPVVSPGGKCDDRVTINSTLGDAYNIILYAHSIDENLAVYVDGKEGGPYESDKILRGNGQSINVSIQASHQIEKGNYTIVLNSTYYANDKDVYSTSNSIIVTVKEKSIQERIKSIQERIKSIQERIFDI